MTGLVFLIKPGYSDAYGLIEVPTTSFDQSVDFTPPASSKEVRLLRTVAGIHILVRNEVGWQQWDEDCDCARPEDDEIARALVASAISVNPERYGSIEQQTGMQFGTTTGVRLSLDWGSLRLRQRGSDTDLIDALYRLHYVQWTGVSFLDRAIVLLALSLLLFLVFVGLRLARHHSPELSSTD